jgi:aryl-alcohol dehydrogenase-like predicted oxidoreductase
LGIAFNAYSPLAGGFLNKTPEDFTDAKGLEGGRFDTSTGIGQVYDGMYNRPLLVKGLAEWNDIAKDSGISKPGLANRWVAFHSALDPKYGDGTIVGARTLEQLREVLDALKEGPLPDGVAQRIEKVWEIAKDQAPLDNFSR